MSVASEKTRIENARDRIRDHLISLGVANGNECIDEIAPIVETLGLKNTKSLSYITATQPTKSKYTKASRLDLTGVIVTAHFEDGSTEDVTQNATFNPLNNTKLNNVGTTNVTISYDYNGVQKSTTISVDVRVSWKNGTDAEIVATLEEHYAGQINIHDYWTVGDTRTVHLSAMEASFVDELHAEQDVVMVLSNAGGKQLANGTECAFIVSQKNCLAEAGYMNATHTNVGGWKECARRAWCNSVYRNSLPSTLKDVFKLHVNKTSQGNNLTTFDETEDYFSLPVEYNVFGKASFSVNGEDNVHWTYYQKQGNQIKKIGSSASYWWERSPRKKSAVGFTVVYDNGNTAGESSGNSRGVAPFGCI